ncbi:hypothetical protein [Devosia sp.]|uniref:hypothetical protein n=1 Tax=Devosia sp. TaxID=1871048 RepID=UPI0032676DF8
MRGSLLVIATVLTVAPVVPAFAGIIEDDFVHGGGCYIRNYDATHLAAHPKQLVMQVNLELSPDQAFDNRTTLYFEFTLRNGHVYGADAYCTASGTCSLEGDGGTFAIAKSGKGIKLSVGDFLELEGEDFSPDLAKSDDRVFLLNKC